MDTIPPTPTPNRSEGMPIPNETNGRKAQAIAAFLALYAVGMAAVIGIVISRRNTPASQAPVANTEQGVIPKPTSAPLCPTAEVAYSYREAAAAPANTCALYLSPREEGWDAETQGEVVMDAPRTGSAIGSLPADIADITNLKVLQANRNDLVSVPSTLHLLQSLTHVSLSTNNFRVIPPDILSLQNLVALDMSRNMITEVPASIGALSKLEHLFLYGNRITSLPPEIGNLTALTVLQLSENRLTRLPDEIRNLTNLTDLYLEKNPLSAGELERIRALLPQTAVHY